MAIVHYLEISYPGLLFTNTSFQKVDQRDIIIEMPNGVMAYRYCSRSEIEIHDELGDELMVGSYKDFSGFYYKGTVFTLSEIKEKLPNERILISNLESRKAEKAILTHFGTWREFNEANDIIIS